MIKRRRQLFVIRSVMSLSLRYWVQLLRRNDYIKDQHSDIVFISLHADVPRMETSTWFSDIEKDSYALHRRCCVVEEGSP